MDRDEEIKLLEQRLEQLKDEDSVEAEQEDYEYYEYDEETQGSSRIAKLIKWGVPALIISAVLVLGQISWGWGNFIFDLFNNQDVRYSVEGSNGAIVREVIADYQALNADTIDFIADNENPAVVFRFANLQNGANFERAFIVNTDNELEQITINDRHNSCDGSTPAYLPDVIANSTIEAVNDYLRFAEYEDFASPRMRAITSELVGEAQIRSQIATLQNSLRQSDNFFARYRLVERIPYSEWDAYQTEIRNRNSALRQHNDATNALHCLRDGDVSVTRFATVEPKRQEGQFTYALDSSITNNPTYQNAVENAIAEWERLNPTINYTQVGLNSPELDVFFNFVDVPEDEDYVGIYCGSRCIDESWYTPSNLPATDYDEILVDTGGRSCNNEFINYTPLYLQDITMHEIGHHLGLGHHLNEEHLLHGTRRPEPMLAFDDLDLNIPAIPDWEYTREGIAEAYDRIAQQEVILDRYPNPVPSSRYSDYLGHFLDYRELFTELNCLFDYESRDQTDDHGSNQSEATPIEFGVPIHAQLHQGDIDYFTFELSEDGIVIIETAGHVDTFGSLLDSDGEVVVSDNDISRSNENFGIRRLIPAGTYYIRVFPIRTNGNYTLTLRLQ